MVKGVHWCRDGLAAHEAAMLQSVLKEILFQILGWTRVNFYYNTDMTHDKCASWKHCIPERVQVSSDCSCISNMTTDVLKQLMKKRRLKYSTNQVLHFNSVWPFTKKENVISLLWPARNYPLSLWIYFFYFIKQKKYIVNKSSNGQQNMFVR